MPDEIVVDNGEQVTRSIGARMTGDQAKTAAATLRRSTTAGAGLGKLAAKTEGMPRQKEGETATDYGARLREWRSKSPVVEGQKKALVSLAK